MIEKLKFGIHPETGDTICTNLAEVLNQVGEEGLRKKYEFEGYIGDFDDGGVDNPYFLTIFRKKILASINHKKYKITLEELPND